jgi:hypothetical protein
MSTRRICILLEPSGFYRVRVVECSIGLVNHRGFSLSELAGDALGHPRTGIEDDVQRTCTFSAPLT